MNVFIVTGTPGTGKTTISIKLAERLDFHYIDVNKIIKKYNIVEGYDRKRKTKIIDVRKLNRALIKEISTIKKSSITKKNSIKSSNIKKSSNHQKNKKGIIIDSHLSHNLPKKYVDGCIVTKCDLKVLKRRLKKKKYSESKIRENLDAEIFDICLNEAKENKHKIIVIDTTKGLNMNYLSRKIK